MQRIIVVGTSGSGKTTLAKQIAEKMTIQHIELDSLHWDANWTEASPEIMRERLEKAMSKAHHKWVMDGNYSRLRDYKWSAADTIIWLDYPRWLVYWRIVMRTLRRVFTREELWSGNQERLRTSFFSKHSVIYWAHKTYPQRKELYSGLMQSDAYPHLRWLHFRSPQETNNWLASL